MLGSFFITFWYSLTCGLYFRLRRNTIECFCENTTFFRLLRLLVLTYHIISRSIPIYGVTPSSQYCYSSMPTLFTLGLWTLVDQHSQGSLKLGVWEDLRFLRLHPVGKKYSRQVGGMNFQYFSGEGVFYCTRRTIPVIRNCDRNWVTYWVGFLHDQGYSESRNFFDVLDR